MIWYIQGNNPQWDDETKWTTNHDGSGSNPSDGYEPWATIDTLYDELRIGATFTGVLTCNLSVIGLGYETSLYSNIPTRFTTSILGGNFHDVAFSLRFTAIRFLRFFDMKFITI